MWTRSFVLMATELGKQQRKAVASLCKKCGSSSEEFHVRRSQVVSRRLQHWRYPDVGPVLEVFERFLASSHGFEVQRAWAFHFALCTHPCDNMSSCGAGDQPWRIQVLKGSWKKLKRCCEHKMAEQMWKPSSCGLWGCEESAKMQVSCRRNSSFHSAACK